MKVGQPVEIVPESDQDKSYTGIPSVRLQDDGEPLHTQGMLIDITARKLAEARAQHYLDVAGTIVAVLIAAGFAIIPIVVPFALVVAVAQAV